MSTIEKPQAKLFLSWLGGVSAVKDIFRIKGSLLKGIARMEAPVVFVTDARMAFTYDFEASDELKASLAKLDSRIERAAYLVEKGTKDQIEELDLMEITGWTRRRIFDDWEELYAWIAEALDEEELAKAKPRLEDRLYVVREALKEEGLMNEDGELVDSDDDDDELTVEDLPFGSRSDAVH